jgi:hypothetical protein
MQIERFNGAPERRILTGLIVDDEILGKVADKWTKEGLFASRWSNLVGSWCCSYYEKYGKAPRKAIEGLFESWTSKNNEKETVELVESFLEGLSGEYETQESNTAYLVDLAGTHFNKVRLERFTENIRDELEAGDVNKALQEALAFSHVEIGRTEGVDVLQDTAAIKRAFARKSEPIVKYPGALGNFFGSALERDGFIAFEGPEKRGKTGLLLDVAWRAMRQGRKVAFIEAGDMSEGQILLRFMVRACRRPLKATMPGHPVKFPMALDHAPDAPFATVVFEDLDFPTPLTWKHARRVCDKLITKQKTDESLLRLSCHPNSTLSASGVGSLIQTWERQGWGLPDIVCLDYADILAPPAGIRETRDQINMTWKQLRALSQSLHCLVVTATQSDTDSYDRETLTMKNFSEDKRKNSHVTGMVGINQTPGEKRLGLLRLNWLALREEEFSSQTCVHVASCLAIANPTIRSTF